MADYSEQKKICAKYAADFVVAPEHLVLGMSLSVKEGMMPINGLRHRPEGETTGWFVYAGQEASTADDFYEPLHVSHVDDWSPLIRKYLGLAPGWRFLVTDDGYEDVWFDKTLLDV